MNAERLLAQFERVANAPDAVPRLRRFILDLAVRAKLVEQNPKDEPAADLLRRIQAEKSLADLKMSDKATRPGSRPQLPFAVPSNWVVVQAGDLLTFVTSGSRGWAIHYSDSGPLFLRLGNLDYGTSNLDLSDVQHVTPPEGAESTRTQVQENDLLISMTGDIGMIGHIPAGFPKAYINQHIGLARPSRLIHSRFLATLFCSPFGVSQLKGLQRGIKNSLGLDDIRSLIVALPPRAEQRRIVAKVDELMALCDRLEAAQAEREGRRDRLVSASLHRLNQPGEDATAFRDDARFALDHLARFTTRPEHIPLLRQTILNLAVRGKLVPQDPKDEPIAASLKRAFARRAELVRSKKVRRKALDSSDNYLEPFEVPVNWIVEKLGLLVDPENTISYGVLVPGNDVPEGVPFVRAQDLALDSHPDRPNKTIAPEVEKPYARTRLRGGEILLCVVGSIGKLGVAPPSWAGANIARAVARIAPVPEVSRDFLLMVLRSEQLQTYFKETTRTLAQPTLNVRLIEQAPIPLPPLAEQRRIVVKVNELMALCDRLEVQLTAARTEGCRFLEAVLHEALAVA